MLNNVTSEKFGKVSRITNNAWFTVLFKKYEVALYLCCNL